MIVIGGGLAGLAASTRLLDQGYDGDLVLLEKSGSWWQDGFCRVRRSDPGPRATHARLRF